MRRRPLISDLSLLPTTYLDAIPIAQLLGSGRCRGFATAQSLKDVIKITRLITKPYRSLFHFVTFDYKNKSAPVPSHQRSFGNQHSWSRFTLGGLRLAQEVDPRVHLGAQLFIGVVYLNFHCHFLCIRASSDQTSRE